MVIINPKICVVTTFPNKHWDNYAARMMESFCRNWPEDVRLWLQLDEDDARSKDVIAQLSKGYQEHFTTRQLDGFTSEYEQEFRDFKDRHKGTNWGKDYRKQYVRFAHKVFAQWKCYKESVAAGLDYLVWLDADIITNKRVTWDAIKAWLPNGEPLAYLGRKDWPHSETGFIVWNLKNEESGKILKKMLDYYLDDSLLKEKQQDDAWAFDLAREGKGKNLTDGLPGMDIFDVSPLAAFMTHYKGNRKAEIAGKPQNQAVNVNNLDIKTKNCLDHETILKNITQNMQALPPEAWLQQVRPHGEELVIVSAGPSLSPDQIMPFYKRGVKILAVKHAMNTLLSANIVPWGCMLLDPRAHVSGFVENPHPDVNYFVSSMVNPEVVKNLQKFRCKVYGYHAYVGAGEEKMLPKGHNLIQGGSATATRGISLMDFLGFRKMHLFAYDCCYLEKPDMTMLDAKGRSKYLEIALSANGWAGKPQNRTFWTEGQFLAQVDEMRKVYLQTPGLELTIHGEGIVPWMSRQDEKFKAWGKWINEIITQKEIDGLPLDEVVKGSTLQQIPAPYGVLLDSEL